MERILEWGVGTYSETEFILNEALTKVIDLMIEDLVTYKQQDLEDLNSLMRELSATSFSNEELLKNALQD